MFIKKVWIYFNCIINRIRKKFNIIVLEVERVKILGKSGDYLLFIIIY